jgi:hypothetical protein
MEFRFQFVLFAAITILLMSPILATVGPVSYLTERVYAHYDTDGTPNASQTYTECPDDSNPCRSGYIEVALPNTVDTLQTVRVNLSGTTHTSLGKVESYRATATSYPTLWSRTKLLVNDTSFGSGQNYYEITNAAVAPAIEFKVVSYSNAQGGYDLYDSDNIGPGGSVNNMNMVLYAKNPSGSKALNSVTVVIDFDKNTNGGADSVNITATSSGSASDSDSDGYNDRITWTNNLAAGANVTFDINFTVTEGVNIADGVTSLNLDDSYSDKGARSGYTEAAALTGLTIAATYSRGAIRQGIDLAESGDQNSWEVRGFFRVLSANSTDSSPGTQLTYNVTDWAIYNVSSSTGNITDLVQSGTYSPTVFDADDGLIYTTDASSSSQERATLPGSGKPYVASYFDWSVVWNDTDRYYVSYINTTLDLPTLYVIDQSVSKAMGGFLSVGVGTQFNVTDETTFTGHNSAAAEKIEINSIIPRNTTLGAARTAFAVDADSIKVYWYNTTSSAYELLKSGTGTSDGVTVSLTQPTGGANGIITVTINDLSATNANKNLEANEKIKLFYNVTSPSDLETGDSFQFTGNMTLTSLSGTPETEAPTPQTLSTSGRQLIGYKDLFIPSPTAPTTVNGTLFVQVVGSEIQGIKFVDYVPLGTDFTCDRASVTFCNSTDGSAWSCGVSSDYNVTDKGEIELPDGVTVRACEYSNGNKAGWSLSSNAAVKILYSIEITNSGLYEMPMAIAGFDPATGEAVMATAMGVIRVTVPEPLVEPQIRQGDFLTVKSVVVGSPVAWMKDFEVYNPNSRFTEAEFSTEVFEDATAGYVSYLNAAGVEVKEEVAFTAKEGKRQMVWRSRLYPGETRVYDVRVITPPVVETDRDVEILGVLENKMVELRMSIFLRSLAAQDYSNVQFNLPISSHNILSIKGSEGMPIPYSGGSNIRVTVPQMPAQGMKEIVIVYKQAYPTIIITPNKDSYGLDSEVMLDILVIHGGEEISYPFIETEVYTQDKVMVYANVQNLERLEPISRTSISEQFRVPMGAPSGRYIAESRLKSDMATLATGTGNFYVSGTASAYAAWVNYIILLLCAGVLYVGVKRLKPQKAAESIK